MSECKVAGLSVANRGTSNAKGVIRFKNARGEKLDEAITELLAEAGHDVVISHEDESDNKEDVDKKQEGKEKPTSTEVDNAQ